MRTTAKRITLIGLTLLLAALVALTATAQSDGQALVRFVHALPGAGAVDIYTDGQLTIAGLDTGEASGFVAMPAGEHALTVTQAGDTTVLWEQALNAGANSAQTLVAATGEPLEFQVYQNDVAPLAAGSARFTAIHAIPDGPAVDVVLADGRPVVSGLNFGQVYGTLDVPAAAYEMAVVPAGEGVDAAIVPAEAFSLNAGVSYILLVYGTADAPQTLLLGATAQAAGEAGYLRVVHAIPGGEPVDVLVNDTAFVSGLVYGGERAPFAAVAPGEYAISVRPAGSDTELVAGSATVEAGQYVTVAVSAAGGAPVLQTFTTDASAVNTDQATVSVINLLTGDATAGLTTSDGASVAADVAAGASGAGVVDAADGGATVSVAGGEQTTDIELPLNALYGGVLYDVIVAEGESGPEAFVAQPVSIAQGIASAPGDATLSADAASETSEIVTDEAAPAAEATTAPTEAAPAATEVAIATPGPQPTDAPPTARVLLDPGANLQLRQYPSSQAFSLGLAPAGAVLTVRGRQGAPQLSVFETPEPEATEWVDPATLLEEREDLPRLETWLFVTYNTPDGGQIDAWVNSHFVQVTTADGNILPLRVLLTIPSNRAGEARDTAVTAQEPAAPTVQAVVGGLDEGVNLQIRRTPDVAGESLTLVPNGTSLELLGMNDERSWAFVRYAEADGGAVTGWVNALFLVEYSYQGQPMRFAQLEERNLIDTIEDTQRGRVAGEVNVPPTPTRDPLRNTVVGTVLLDEGAHLQLRRNPNINAESLGLIPAGEQVPVSARDESGQWLRVKYDNTEGWVSAAYMRLTFNGLAYDLASVPVFGTGATAPLPAGPEGTAEATAAPTAVTQEAEIVVDVIGMTHEPGGDGTGLPVLTRGRVVKFVFTTNDGQFSLIELEDGTAGWVPSYAVLVH